MPSTSSLLRSSASTRKKVLSQQDAEAEYEYSLGYKTYEDYREYDRYLDKRASSTTDPGQALTLQKRRNTAFRGYMGNEIQRQTIGVLEGRQSNTDKYNAMYSLYQNAVSQGLYDQAQTLYLQLGNLDRTIQNEAVAAAGSASASATAAATAVNDEVKAHQAALKDLGAVFTQLGPDQFDAGIRSMQKEIVATYPDLAPVFEAKGEVGIFDIASGIMENIKDTYAAAISELPADKAAEMQVKLDSLNSGATKFDIPGFADKVSLTDLRTQMAQAQEGRSYFFRGQGGELQKGEVTDYTWDKNGKVIPVYADPLSGGTKDNPYLQTVDNFKDSGAYRRDAKGDYVDAQGNVVARSVVQTFKDQNGVDQTRRVIVGADGKEFASEALQNEALSRATMNAATLLREQGFNVVSDGGEGFKKGKNGGALVTVTEDIRDKFGDIPGVQNGEPIEMFVDGQGNLRFTPERSGKLYQAALGLDNQYTVRELKSGEQGAINLNTMKDLALDMTDMERDLRTKGVNQVAGKSLIASNERIAQGVGFTKGVLKDAETRRRFLAGEAIQNARGETVVNDVRQNPALRLNTAERALNSAARTVRNAPQQIKTTVTSPFKTFSRTLDQLARIGRPGAGGQALGAVQKAKSIIGGIDWNQFK